MGLRRRPIFWGGVAFAVGSVGFVISVVLTVLTAGKLRMVSNVLGTLTALSLPAAIVWELALWIKKKI
jgi:hypothetical protein